MMVVSATQAGAGYNLATTPGTASKQQNISTLCSLGEGYQAVALGWAGRLLQHCIFLVSGHHPTKSAEIHSGV
jgi:hypothetical protein